LNAKVYAVCEICQNNRNFRSLDNKTITVEFQRETKLHTLYPVGQTPAHRGVSPVEEPKFKLSDTVADEEMEEMSDGRPDDHRQSRSIGVAASLGTNSSSSSSGVLNKTGRFVRDIEQEHIDIMAEDHDDDQEIVHGQSRAVTGLSSDGYDGGSYALDGAISDSKTSGEGFPIVNRNEKVRSDRSPFTGIKLVSSESETDCSNIGVEKNVRDRNTFLHQKSSCTVSKPISSVAQGPVEAEAQRRVMYNGDDYVGHDTTSSETDTEDPNPNQTTMNCEQPLIFASPPRAGRRPVLYAKGAPSGSLDHDMTNVSASLDGYDLPSPPGPLPAHWYQESDDVTLLYDPRRSRVPERKLVTVDSDESSIEV
jgi:hypothetical protein